jgi:hypothetical protein
MPWPAERFAAAWRCVIVAPEPDKIEAVSKVSAWRKMGVVARVAGQQAGRNRTLSAVMGAVRTTARSLGRVLHLLWLEVTGVIFLIMALSFAGASFKEYGKYHAGQAGVGRLAAAVCFTLTFAWFGLSSFWRVRRKSQRS